jgi:hypothetical protein
LHVPLPLHRPEQQLLFCVQGCPGAAQGGPQSGSLAAPQPGLQQPSAGPHGGKLCWQPDDALQLSAVQALPSLQLTGLCWQPVRTWHESVVQALPSEQFSGSFEHIPPAQASTVQALSSSQSAGNEQVGAQSIAQLAWFSLPVQLPSPQQLGATGEAVQPTPPAVQRGSLQGTGFWPLPSPQQ